MACAFSADESTVLHVSQSPDGERIRIAFSNQWFHDTIFVTETLMYSAVTGDGVPAPCELHLKGRVFAVPRPAFEEITFRAAQRLDDLMGYRLQAPPPKS